MLAGKNGEFINGGINLTEVIDTGGRLRTSPGPEKIRNGNRGQEGNNGHYNHDLDEGKSSPTIISSGCLHFLTRCGHPTGTLSILLEFAHELPAENFYIIISTTNAMIQIINI